MILTFVAYTGLKEIMAQFEQDTGIKVQYLEMSSGEVLTRIRAAEGKAQADAWFGGGLDSYVAAMADGFLEAYVSPERAVYDPMFYNADGYWSGMSIGAVDILANEEVLKEKGLPMPESWEALGKYNTQAPVRPGVKLAPNIQAMRDSNLMKMDPVKGGEERDEVLAVWQEKFGAK